MVLDVLSKCDTNLSCKCRVSIGKPEKPENPELSLVDPEKPEFHMILGPGP